MDCVRSVVCTHFGSQLVWQISIFLRTLQILADFCQSLADRGRLLALIESTCGAGAFFGSKVGAENMGKHIKLYQSKAKMHKQIRTEKRYAPKDEK